MLLLRQRKIKKIFFNAFEASNPSTNQKEIKTFVEINKGKSVEELLIWGVMVTGEKNWNTLKDKLFIRGNSIGVIAPIVPYITPEK